MQRIKQKWYSEKYLFGFNKKIEELKSSGREGLKR